jgi:hypothetical protein
VADRHEHAVALDAALLAVARVAERDAGDAAALGVAVDLFDDGVGEERDLRILLRASSMILEARNSSRR